MPSAKKRGSSSDEVVALRRRVAELESQLVESQGLVSGLRDLDALVTHNLGKARLCVVLYSKDLGSVLFASSNCQFVLGCPVEALQADPRAWMSFVDESDSDQVAAVMSGAVHGRSTGVVYRANRGGEIHWVRLRAAPSREGAALASIACFFTDITELKQSEAAARASEERFRALALHSPIGILQIDLEVNCTFVNQRFCVIAGLSPEECAERGWLSTIHAEDLPQFLAEWRDAIAARREFSQELRFVRGDGVERWAMISAVQLCDASGQPTSCLGSVKDITDRKFAESALRASEERFRLVAHGSPAGIFLSDSAGNVVYSNPRLQEIYGLTAAEIKGLGFARVFDPRQKHAILEQWHHVCATVAAHDDERQIINGRGESRWVHVRSLPMCLPSGEVQARVGAVNDITERRQAEHELRESEKRCRLLAENATDMISRHSQDGVFLYASPASSSMLGYEPAELVGLDAYEFAHPDDRDGIRATLQKPAPAFESGTLTYRSRRKDGEYIWLETIWKSIPGPNRPGSGPEIEIIAVSRDITVRRQAAEQLQASEARMRSVLNTVSDGIVSVDESGTIERFSPGAEQLFGYRAEEVLGQDVRMLLPADQFDGYERRARRSSVFRRPLAKTQEIIGLRKDGSKVELELRVGETVVGGRSLFTGILHDTSRRKRTERLLRESEKLAATGRIAARIAHEINNPLAGIKNSFLLIKDAVPVSHPHHGYVARIEKEIDRIARIVRQMFDLYRPAGRAVEQIDLKHTMTDVVALLGSVAATRNVTLQMDADRVTRPVRLLEDPLRQILYNLIVNAIEASPQAHSVKVDAVLAKQAVHLFVADAGPGIPPGLREQIYEPFFTTKSGKSTGGLGLGLSIARGLVEALEGTLDFESDPRRGTVFHVCLPTVADEDPVNYVSTSATSVRR